MRWSRPLKQVLTLSKAAEDLTADVEASLLAAACESAKFLSAAPAAATFLSVPPAAKVAVVALGVLLPSAVSSAEEGG